MVDADCQFEGLIAAAADPRDIDVNHTGPIISGGVAVADAAEHAFDDVKVMLFSVQAAHTGLLVHSNA